MSIIPLVDSRWFPIKLYANKCFWQLDPVCYVWSDSHNNYTALCLLRQITYVSQCLYDNWCWCACLNRSTRPAMVSNLNTNAINNVPMSTCLSASPRWLLCGLRVWDQLLRFQISGLGLQICFFHLDSIDIQQLLGRWSFLCINRRADASKSQATSRASLQHTLTFMSQLNQIKFSIKTQTMRHSTYLMLHLFSLFLLWYSCSRYHTKYLLFMEQNVWSGWAHVNHERFRVCILEVRTHTVHWTAWIKVA